MSTPERATEAACNLAWGEIAYESYREAAGGKSLATGHPIPPWDKLPVEIQVAWEVSAAAVRQTCANVLTQSFVEPVNEERGAISSADLIARTTRPEVQGAVNERGSGRHA